MQHTKDKLADALMQIGLFDMSIQARGGYYHEYLSPLAFPEVHLVDDLARVGTPEALALRDRVVDGEFDATLEESDAWAASPEGQHVMSELLKGKGGKRGA